MSIENAARELHHRLLSKAEIEEIIRLHLFPSVKPEEVRPRTWYFARLRRREEWNCVYMNVLGFLSGDRISAFDEIRGPVPMPE